MGLITGIEWTNASLSPWEGCTKVSPGCANCYAEARDRRFHGGAHWGAGRPRRRVASFEKAAVALNRRAEREGTRYRVFPSICDWLDPEVPFEWFDEFLQVVRETPNLDWQLLTKRPELFRKRLNTVAWVQDASALGVWVSSWLSGIEVPENVWVGVSVEDQVRADERVPALLEIPAAVRFVSAEPLLAPVNLDVWLGPNLVDAVDWVIVGGESGPGARVCEVDRVSSLVLQCRRNGVPCFVKQLGSNVEWMGKRLPLGDGKGGRIDEWPGHLRVREMPNGEVKSEKVKVKSGEAGK